MRGHLRHLPERDAVSRDGRAVAAMVLSAKLGPVCYVSYYGPCGGSSAQHTASLRQAWELATRWATPWLIGGDFNSPPAATAARLASFAAEATLLALPPAEGTCWTARGSVSNID